MNNAIKIIRNEAKLEEIIKKCNICYVSMVDEGKPYIVAMNFGYKDKTLYFHSDQKGKKIDVLKKNNVVSIFFTADTEVFARHPEVACSWRMRYRSVVVNGVAEFVEDYEEKEKALLILMKNFTNEPIKFSKPAIDNVLIFKVKVQDWRGRSFEY